MFICDIDKRPHSGYLGCENNIKLFHILKSWVGKSVCLGREIACKFSVHGHNIGILILSIK